MRLNTTVRHPSDSNSSNAAARHGADGSGMSHGQSGGSTDSSPGTLRAELKANMLEKFQSTMGQVLALSKLSSGSPRHMDNCSAMLRTAKFYQTQIHPLQNKTLLDQDDRFLRLNECAWPGPVARQINAGITRKASFLTVKPVLEDIGILTNANSGEPLPLLDPASREVLERTLSAAQTGMQVSAWDAVDDVLEGRRARPLTMDYVRFTSFISSHEDTLLRVRNACAAGTPSSTQLKPLLESLARDYLRTNGRLPRGLPPDCGYMVDGVSIGSDPVTVLVGRSRFCDARYSLQEGSSLDTVLLRIGRNVLSDSAVTHPIVEGFESRDPASQRAALILGAFFRELTVVEEQIAASGMHCRTPGDRAESERTREELSYAGSDPVGDALTPIGASDRDDALKPLRNMPGVMQRYQQTHGEPLVSDPEICGFIEGPHFDTLVDTLAVPAERLAALQLGSTNEALLECRALGGPGFA